MNITVELTGEPGNRLGERATSHKVAPEVIAQSILADALTECPCDICGEPRRSPMDGVGTGTGMAHPYCYDPDVYVRRLIATVVGLGLLWWILFSNEPSRFFDTFRWLLTVVVVGLMFMVNI